MQESELMSAGPPPGFPIFAEDPFSIENLANSRTYFNYLRDLGDVVWVPAINMFVAARYRDVVAALRAPEVFISGEGVALNELSNEQSASTSTITSDGDLHRRFKSVEIRPLRPIELRNLEEKVQDLASAKISELADGSTFDAMAQLATHLPVNVVTELVGIRELTADKMLRWSNAAFDSFGPLTQAPTQEELDTLQELGIFAAQIGRNELTPGGWASRLWGAVDNGELTEVEARGLLSDYIIPSLDTTILSTGEMLFQLAQNPDLLDRLRQQPELIVSAVYESVRLATPIRGFTRKVVREFAFSESVVPAGSRIWLLYAAANRDERHFDDPDQFIIDRSPRDHLGWGLGVHNCVGKHLAILEMSAILRALLGSVERIEIDQPTRIINRGVQGYKVLPTRLIPRSY